MLFGQVDRPLRAPRLPSRRASTTADSPSGARRAARGQAGAASRPLRPPDLIIQDELHLITGPLGTLVGLYETAVDELCTWKLDGTRGAAEGDRLDRDDPPRAATRCSACSLRRVEVFPPPGLDAGDNFFADPASSRATSIPGGATSASARPGGGSSAS